MTKKIPLGITIILIIVSIAATAVITVFVYLSHYDDLLADLPQRAQQYNKLSEVDELVRQKYFGEIDYDSLDKSLVQGYLAGLDENCFYIPADDYEAYNRLINGNLSGIGVSVYYDAATDNLLVTSVDNGSPAFVSGITNGSYILSVDGNDVNRDNAEAVISDLTATYDKKLNLVFVAADSDTSVEKIVTSGYLDNSVEYSIDENIGYIRISDIYDNTAELFLEAVDYFNENSVDKIILDLRNTDDTNFEVAADIIDIIVPVGSEGTGALYTAKDSEGNTVKQRSSDSTSLDFFFAVLVNSRTQGAAELIACDIRDYSKGLIFGETTYGNGTYQDVFRLQDGAAVLLTVAEIYPYISDSFNNVGIEPDVIIPTTESFKNQFELNIVDEDEQYNSAYAYLSSQK